MDSEKGKGVAMSDFQFLHPYAWLLLIPLLFFLFWSTRHKNRASIWSQVCSKDLLPYLLAPRAKRLWFRDLLIFSTGFLCITALAGPSWGSMSHPLLKSRSAVIIALDLSDAMDAQDVKPSRLQRAIYKIRDFLTLRREGQTALIVFSKEAFVVTPLTDDARAIQALLPALETTIMPSGGHQADRAIAKAAELLKQGGIAKGAILLITSALSEKEKEASIALAAEEQFSISVLAVGTEEGAPIPKQKGGFMTDEKGGLILSVLAKENLTQLAQSTHGSFASLALDDSDLTQLNESLTPSWADPHKEIEATTSQRQDQGVLFVLLALPFALLFFRRGMCALGCLLMPHLLDAVSWSDWWKTRDQQGAEFFQEGDYEKAKDLFENKDWKAAAYDRLGDYAQAADLYRDNHSPDGYYNYGTAKAKQGDFKAALEAYAKTLERQPDHEDALYNKKLIEEMKQQQEEESKKPRGQDQEQSDPQKESQQEGEQQEKAKKPQGEDQERPDPQKESQQEGQENDPRGGKTEHQGEKKDEGAKEENNKSSDLGNEQGIQQEQEIETKEEKNGEELQNGYRAEMDQKVEENGHKPFEQREGVSDEPPPEKDFQRQLDDRWLQKIHDDPGGLLRRKFLLQHRQQKGKGSSTPP